MREFRKQNIPGEPSAWCLVKDGDTVKVAITCPNGHHGLLDHDISADGIVTPSVMCPVDACGFHDNIKLQDYNLTREMNA